MAPQRIISWAANLTSSPPIESISSDSSSGHAAQSQVKSMSLLPVLEDKKTGVQHANDDTFTRHNKYYFKDGNITFLVKGTVYCVHRHFFSQHSKYFSTRIDQLEIHDHEALSITISLGDIECEEFEAFLSILYPDDFSQYYLHEDQWESVLRLSTLWGFATMRQLALESIHPATSFDRLLLARTYSVGPWLAAAISALCERTEPLSLDEARQMRIEDVVIISTIREDIRDHALQVDSHEIRRRVKVAMRKANAEELAKEAGKRKADAEPAEHAADEEVRRTVGKAAKRKEDEGQR